MKVTITVKDAVIQAQGGNRDAIVALLKKYQPIVAKGIGQALAYRLEIEDLESILFLSMIVLLQKIDVSKLK